MTCPKHHCEMITICMGCLAERKKGNPKAAAASRRNGKLGGEPLSKRKCRKCKTSRLSVRNRSGICRKCRRHPGRNR